MITLSEVYDRLVDIHTCEEDMCGCGIHKLLADVMGSLPPYQNDRVKELESALRLALAVAEDDPILVTEPEKEICRLREQVRQLQSAPEIKSAIIQMVRIGNELNWNEPMDQQFVDALNGLRGIISQAEEGE